MMQRLRLFVLGIVGFLGVFFAHGSWLNRFLAFTLCGVLSADSGLCMAQIAKFSGQANATTPILLSQRSSEFDDPPDISPSNNPQAPPFPQDAGPNIIRPEFANPDQNSPSTSPSVVSPSSVSQSSSTDEAPVHAFYINGINTGLDVYNNDLEMISNLIADAGISLASPITSTYNESGWRLPGLGSLGDLAQSLRQSVSFPDSGEGRAFTESIINTIKEIDENENNKEKCKELPKAKFLIISHSQGNFFAEKIMFELQSEPEIFKRIRILAISPFTDFRRRLSQPIPDDRVMYMLRGDDFPARLRILPNVDVPGVNLPNLPGLSTLDSHSLYNYVDPSQASRNTRNAVQQARDLAISNIQDLLAFDSGKYEKEEDCPETASQPTPNASPDAPTVASGVCSIPQLFWDTHVRRVVGVDLPESYCYIHSPVMTREGPVDGVQECGRCDKGQGIPPYKAPCNQAPPDDTARANRVPRCPRNWTGGAYPTPEDLTDQLLDQARDQVDRGLRQIIPAPIPLPSLF